MLGKIRDLGGVPAMSGILRRRSVSGKLLSRAIAKNNWLADHCMSNWWSFLDN